MRWKESPFRSQSVGELLPSACGSHLPQEGGSGTTPPNIPQPTHKHPPIPLVPRPPRQPCAAGSRRCLPRAKLARSNHEDHTSPNPIGIASLSPPHSNSSVTTPHHPYPKNFPAPPFRKPHHYPQIPLLHPSASLITIPAKKILGDSQEPF